MSTNNNPKGIILIITAMTFFSMQDALIKFIYEKAALYEIFFGRYFVAAVLLFGYIKFRKQKVSLKTFYPNLTLLRVVLHFIAFSAFFISLTYMPLATANALFFSSPFFVSIFAKVFLKEFIGIRRWSAIAFGFFGVLVVLNPNKIADHLLIPINYFKNTFANIDTKNGEEKKSALAVANGIYVKEIKKAENAIKCNTTLNTVKEG